MEHLLILLRRFILGTDRSVAAAREIEECLMSLELDEDSLFEDLLHQLAAYQPGGGSYLFNENALVAEMKWLVEEHKKRE